jgi:hypothetical protein
MLKKSADERKNSTFQKGIAMQLSNQTCRVTFFSTNQIIYISSGSAL